MLDFGGGGFPPTASIFTRHTLDFWGGGLSPAASTTTTRREIKPLCLILGGGVLSAASTPPKLSVDCGVTPAPSTTHEIKLDFLSLLRLTY